MNSRKFPRTQNQKQTDGECERKNTRHREITKEPNIQQSRVPERRDRENTVGKMIKIITKNNRI